MNIPTTSVGDKGNDCSTQKKWRIFDVPGSSSVDEARQSESFRSKRTSLIVAAVTRGLKIVPGLSLLS